MTDTCFVLKENSKAIRKKIEDAGIHVCICASFKDSCWLDFHTSVGNGVHGVGYYGEEVGTRSQKEELDRFVAESRHITWCADVDTFIYKIKEFRNENR